MKRTVRALLLVGCAIIAPTLASAGIGVDIDIAPPASRVEVLPPPRPGFVWAPGFWDYRDRGHVWVPGRWVGERRGYRWVADRWEQRGPHWHREPGHWER